MTRSAFAERLAGALTLVATMQGAPVGFASLAGADEIDMLYVHPAAARQGVAALLVDALEKLAAGRGAKRARGRCQRHRARLLRASRLRRPATQHGARNGEWLANTTVEEDSSPPTKEAP